jgi:hypothetical protein
MNRVFWILITVEVVGLLVALAVGWKSPSDSGGREMGIAFGIVLPLLVLAGAALAFHFSSSSVVKNAAFFVAVAPGLGLLVIWGRNLMLDAGVSGARIREFPDGPQRALARAVSSGNAGKAKQLAPTAKLNQPSESGNTFLSLALLNMTPGTVEMVRALLKAGADPNQATEKGWTIPLVRAILLKNADLIKALLDAGADPNQPNPYGTVSYHVALDDPDPANLGIFVLLLDRGGKLEAADASGRTALMNAAMAGNWRAMDVLLQRGANRNAKDKDGKTASDYNQAKFGEFERSHQTIQPEWKAVAERLRPAG